MPYISDQQLKLLLSSARQQFVYDLLLGGLYHARETWERMELLGIMTIPRIVVSVRLENYYALTFDKSERWKHRLRRGIQDFFQERLPDEILVAPMTDNLVALLISLPASSREKEGEEIRALLTPMAEEILQHFSVRVRFGLGSVYNDPRLLHFSFQESVQALNREKEGGIFCFAENPLPESPQPRAMNSEPEGEKVQNELSWPDSPARAAAHRLALGDGAGVIAQLQAALAARLRAGENNPLIKHNPAQTATNIRIPENSDSAGPELNRAVIAVLELAFAVLKETFPEHREECALEEFPQLWAAPLNESGLDPWSWLSGFGERLLHWAERYGIKENPKVSAVRAYVEENLGGDLSLKSVAEVVYLVPAYFSQLFKKTTGESFTDYVSGQRLNKACQLLQNTAYPVREIAERVGFQDVNYFARAFKQRYKKTPLEFRKGNK